MENKILGYLPFVVLAVITIAMATFSFIGEPGDTTLYSNPLMILGWVIVVALAGLLLFKKRKTLGIATLLIHVSFVVILVGALFSHFSESGVMHIREGQTLEFAVKDNTSVMKLPFSITLQKFEIEYYHASDAPKDFISIVETCGRASNNGIHRISMNKVLDIDGYRMFQSSYDEDLKGSVIIVAHDPVGTTITYIGYVMLAFSMILFLFGRRSYFRQVLASPLWKTFTVVALTVIPSLTDAAPRTFPKGNDYSDVDEMLGNVHILYNGRIAPLETYALDFTRKLTGKDSYGEFSATQVLAGWIFFPEEWRHEKMIKSEYGVLDFDSAIDTLNKGLRAKLMTKEFNALDEKIGLILDLQSGAPLKIFPVKSDSSIVWMDPASDFKGGMKGFVDYVKDKWPADDFVPENKHQGKYDSLWEVWYLLKVGQNYTLYPRGYSKKQQILDHVEHLYNRYCKTAPLAYASLLLGLLSFVLMIMGNQNGLHKYKWLFVVASAIIFICISAIMAMRGVISGRFPMSNGYETMLFISWIAFASTIIAGLKLPLAMPAGFFVGGFALLVSKLGMMNPEITPLMPVLASPWMSIHVTLMMLSYTAYAIMAFNSVGYLILEAKALDDRVLNDTVVENGTGIQPRMALLNRFLIYPATFMLAIGMFIGAVWANESWGSYWSWDPKETWALITMIIYAMAFHRESISWMKNDKAFQIYILVSFASIIMTYFGVNYLLGGMHSYAG